MKLNPRLTTAEAAARLGCDAASALLLLKAASIPFDRGTRFGPYLWDAAAVEHLVKTLHEQVKK